MAIAHPVFSAYKLHWRGDYSRGEMSDGNIQGKCPFLPNEYSAEDHAVLLGPYSVNANQTFLTWLK